MAIQHEAIKSRSNIYNVDPRQIKVIDGWNPRTDFSGETDLMASIIENGVQVPINVKRDGDDVCLVNGERRLRATLRVISLGHDIATVPCIFARKNISDTEALFLSLISNDGKRLDPIEEAAAFQRLKNWGLPVKEIATKIGKSDVYIYRRLLLIDASPELQSEVKSKNISLSDAEQIVKGSAGSVEKQKRKLQSKKKSNRLKTKEIKSLIDEKQAFVDSYRNHEKRDYFKGYVLALRNVLDRTTLESEME